MPQAARPPLGLHQLVPLLMVESMEASLRFYVDGVGFLMKHRWIDEGTGLHFQSPTDVPEESHYQG